MDNIIVFGSSGHAKVVIDAIENQQKYTIKGIITHQPSEKAFFQTYPILGSDSDLVWVVKEYFVQRGVIAIGNNQARRNLVNLIRNQIPDFEFVTVIHPRAVVAPASQIGVGSVIFPGAVVNTDAKIGNHVIVNTNASVDHDCTIEDYVSIGPNAALAGRVYVQEEAMVGMGASIIQSIRVGKKSVIGAGAVVITDIMEGICAVGVPTRIIKKNIGSSLDTIGY